MKELKLYLPDSHVQAFQLINFLGESQGIYPLPSIYNCFLGYCAKVKSIDHANQCLDLMDRRMVEKNQVTYVQLLKVCRVECCYNFLFMFLDFSLECSPIALQDLSCWTEPIANVSFLNSKNFTFLVTIPDELLSLSMHSFELLGNLCTFLLTVRLCLVLS